MAKFPVEISDSEGIIDGLNYVLSGPSGLGQNFAGFSQYTLSYLTGNYRAPYTQPGIANLYVPPISLSTSEMIDPRTTKYTFSSIQPSPPFSLGNPVTISGVSVPFYNGNAGVIGIVECTTAYCLVRWQNEYFEPIGTGGSMTYTNTILNDLTSTYYISTDCNARVTVTSATDRVFISAQLDAISIDYISNLPFPQSSNLTYTVAINRYVAVPNYDPTNPDFVFIPDGDNYTVSKKTILFQGAQGGPSIQKLTGYLGSPNEVTFSTVIDTPTPGYYWYILEVAFNSDPSTGSVIPSDLEVVNVPLGLRSLSAQVVKQ